MNNVNCNCEIDFFSQFLLEIKHEQFLTFCTCLCNKNDESEEPELSVQNVQLPKALVCSKKSYL